MFIFLHAVSGFGISYNNAKALRLNIQLNAIQFVKKDKAFKIARELLKYDQKNEDLEHVALEVLSRPDTEERTRAILLKVYFKQNKLTGHEKNRTAELIGAAKITGSSEVMSKALQALGIKAYPKMVKALQCSKNKRRRKKSRSRSKSSYPVAQQSLAQAIDFILQKNKSSKAVKKSGGSLMKCFKCASSETALLCGKAIGRFDKLSSRTLNSLRSILVNHKDKQRKIAAANMLARFAPADKRSQRALEAGIRSRNELTRLTSATALYSKLRSHHGARKALEKLGKSAKKDEYRQQALKALQSEN